MRLTINKKDKLDKINKCFLNMAEGIIKAGDSKVYELDFYILSILNRAISLNKAFTHLLRDRNSLTAISLVRMQLDNALRLNAIKIVQNRDDFLSHFFQGKGINSYKEGKEKFSDKFLASKLNKDVPGTLDLYEYLCKFVHFSENHFEATKSAPLNQKANFRIVVGDSDILNKDEKNAFYERMTGISNTIIRISKEWINTKSSMV
ncbi:MULTISPECIES: hypothetical protein [Arenibacter]|jgi:hypothetical protein|uniref:Abortive infection protein, AbiV family n=1 Tax=Arenibacter troitsensis TaxID=188872 RepID=A0A1X7IGA8_9FLAO|nr:MULTISPECIES: hypothetical protein [Arenibacter]MCK0135688.1 hypothetical protein [Arenibacter sp. S6351L]MCK0192987.1 hypothetical protein [Arenibacter sp. F20364]MDO6603583.1 hypothetical protein [Arenibacter palladensis]MDX1766807.1 hypothetical protein [Arenibacter troitsensis]SMG13403.1 hypothetical protein SAMN03080602_00776 [Arenibacter troitsensis]|tara:strand:+ start:1145 stop:1759 length:615 start_codon:yes stop_codon:yes gene_type:complete